MTACALHKRAAGLASCAQVRPDVYPKSDGLRREPDALLAQPGSDSITVLSMPSLEAPLDPAVGWLPAQTMSMSNFTIACKSQLREGGGNTTLMPGQQAQGQPNCLSRVARSEVEIMQARLDDCRHLVSLPSNASGQLQAPLLTRNWFQWDRDFAFNTTLTGIAEMQYADASDAALVVVPISPDAWFQLWYFDVIAQVQDLLSMFKHLQFGGPGKIVLNNTRWALTDCPQTMLPVLESIVVTVRVLAETPEDNATVDRDLGIIHYSEFKGSVAPQSYGLFGFFGQEFRFEVYNTSIICCDGWDVQHSVNQTLRLQQEVPPSLLGLRRSPTDSAAPAAARSGGSAGSMPAATVVALVVALAAAGLLAALLLAVLVKRRGWAHRRRYEHSDTAKQKAVQQEADDCGSERQESKSKESYTGVSSSEVAASPTLLEEGLATHPDSESFVTAQATLPPAAEPAAGVEDRLPPGPLLAPMQQLCLWLDEEPPPPDTAKQQRPAGEGPADEQRAGEEALPGTSVLEQRQAELPQKAACSGGDGDHQRLVQQVLGRFLPRLAGVDLGVDMQKEVRLGRVLGEGSSSTVYEGWWHPGTEKERHVAVKVMDLDVIETHRERERFLRAFRNELDILSRIDHPGIVHCFGGCLSSNSVAILLEYMPAGTLAHYIHSTRARCRFTPLEVLTVAEELASALAYLHPIIVHSDVKPDNCLLTQEGHVKLGDLGLSRVKLKTAMHSSVVPPCTPRYTAPEVFQGGVVSEKCDIYSLAVLLWECWTGRHPWVAISNPAQLYRMVSVDGKRLPLPAGSNPEVAALLALCWQQQPELRPSAAEVMRKAQLLRAYMQANAE